MAYSGSTTGARNDYSCSCGSQVMFTPVSGTTYYIYIDGRAGASGTYTLHVSGY